ncbi:MAG TPA: GNAT family N-acetyltransferase [Bauldia sp.]|nr:GNAT family N-acetyltransferase [Bauldia sp.]
MPEALAGRGIGGKIARLVLDAARAEGIKVVPVCPFIAAWMKKHPEYDDLRA